jgi:hypothetical protein
MIGTTLNYIRKRVNDHLTPTPLSGESDNPPERVTFIDGDKLEPLTISPNAISMLVVNVEEERELRKPNSYQLTATNGEVKTVRNIYPDIHLMISILFVARFKSYSSAWDYLTKVIGFFQVNPVLDKSNDPRMPPEIVRLASELISQTFQQQNEVWSALRISQHPSVLYRIKLLAVQADESPGTAPEVQTLITHTKHLDNSHAETFVSGSSP